ncbi:uncharacterized protein ARMOST_14387 [Armillaria ostoyae]|uniref:Uncharacterized protein n=1 Tax=Armillaria ostoyae TaxID=47428 RepID=A0A284RQG6_ARMOS|nr:uncharacterized protein ARMOST_14387 [Armillaria ostoyae]
MALLIQLTLDPEAPISATAVASYAYPEVLIHPSPGHIAVLPCYPRRFACPDVCTLMAVYVTKVESIEIGNAMIDAAID